MLQIMIVDDEIMSQEIIKNFIDSYLPQYHVQCVCSNGIEALTRFDEDACDIVLVDIHMPIMNGITLIEELNKKSKDYVPIVISGYAEFEYAKSAMKLGVSHYLLKPLDFKELERSLIAASYALTQKRELQTSLNWAEENQEIFFTRLLSGEYMSKKEAITNFGVLHFPFSYDKSAGIFIQISIERNGDLQYEFDIIHSEIKQLIHTLCPVHYVYSLVITDNICNFLLVGDTIPHIPVDEVVFEVNTKLGIPITVSYLHNFSSLEELRIYEPLMCVTISDNNQAKSNRETIENCIKNAVEYIQGHYSEDLTREVVASQVYMSGAYFSRCFKMIMKISYKDYLTEIRMQKAIELLNTCSRIQDIAKLVGYPNTNRFNINFKNFTSYTPSEYRRDVLKNHVD